MYKEVIPLAKDYLEKYVIDQMRLQRHDFMNYLQVIYGYIQINKPQDAINYIKNINKYMMIIGKIFSLECDAFGILFQEFINKCSKFKIEIELDIRIEYISCEHFSKDIDKKKILFDAATDKLLDSIEALENCNQKLYIYFNGLPENFNIIISSVKILNTEDYFSSIISEAPCEGIEEKNKSYLLYKNDGVLALKLNFS